jgi:hypothetical protein
LQYGRYGFDFRVTSQTPFRINTPALGFRNARPKLGTILELSQSAAFSAKINSDYNDFVARVALEVVDSAWCKQQLRVKSAGGRTTQVGCPVLELRPVSSLLFFRWS